jgi:hypothetical protein
VSIEEQHVALPKLYGAPAYARPPTVAETAARPLDPDDLPITAQQTDEERLLAEALTGRTYGTGGGADISGFGEDGSETGSLRPRPLSLKAIAGRLLGS